jgi:hypothetical protein
MQVDPRVLEVGPHEGPALEVRQDPVLLLRVVPVDEHVTVLVGSHVTADEWEEHLGQFDRSLGEQRVVGVGEQRLFELLRLFELFLIVGARGEAPRLGAMLVAPGAVPLGEDVTTRPVAVSSHGSLKVPRFVLSLAR